MTGTGEKHKKARAYEEEKRAGTRTKQRDSFVKDSFMKSLKHSKQNSGVLSTQHQQQPTKLMQTYSQKQMMHKNNAAQQLERINYNDYLSPQRQMLQSPQAAHTGFLQNNDTHRY